MSIPAAMPSAVVASVASSRSLGGQVQDAPEGRLAARPEEDRPPEHAQRAEVAEQLQVVVGRLAEPEPGIDDEVVPRDAEPGRAIERALEVGDELRHERPVDAAPHGCA